MQHCCYGLFNLHSNSRLTYRPTRSTLYGPTCSAKLSGYWKQFCFPARQCPNTCDMALNCLQGGHVIPIDWAIISRSISNWPPWGIRDGGTWLLSLPSCHITQIRRPAGWTMATTSADLVGVQMYTQASSKHAQILIECFNKGGGYTRYDLQYINL